MMPPALKIARDVAAGVLSLARITAPDRVAKGRLTIVTLHRVLPPELARDYPYPVLAISPDQLDFCLRYFLEHFTCGPLTEMYDRFRSNPDSDKPLLAITFDDGQKDNVEHGWPVLARHGVRATFYVPADAIEKKYALWHDTLGFALMRGFSGTARQKIELTTLFGIDPATAPNASEYATWVSLDVKKLTPEDRAARIEKACRIMDGATVPEWSHLMSWAQASELIARGNEIGSHSMTHPLLPQLDETGVEYEIGGSRKLIEERTHTAVRSFCYPNGDHDARIVEVTRRAGYDNAVTAGFGNNEPGIDAFRLKRFDLIARQTLRADGTPSRARLAWWISGSYPAY